MIKFVTDYPALFLPGLKVLIIVDLHLGLERELYERGIIIPPQAPKMKKLIDNLINVTKAKKLIILGDVKHIVPGISFREQKEIPKLINSLAKKVKIEITKGNHDSYLEKIIPKRVKIHASKGFKIGCYGFFHGHAWPSKQLLECDYLFMGHVHPMIEFKDRLGYRLIEQVWVKTKLKKDLVAKKYKIDKKNLGELNLLILPCFNKLVGGTLMNTKPSKDLIGPILANEFTEISKAEIFMLDGTFLGKLKELKRFC
jgi:hypothetical protein